MKRFTMTYTDKQGKRGTHDFYAKSTAIALLCAKDFCDVQGFKLSLIHIL